MGTRRACLFSALVVATLASTAAASPGQGSGVSAIGISDLRDAARNVAAPLANSFGVDAVEKELVQRLLTGIVNRFRRGIALGPFAGVVGGHGFSSDPPTVAGISVGLGVYTFKQPTILDVPRLVSERLKKRMMERVKAMVTSGGAPPTDLGDIARQVAEDVYKEVFGELNQRSLLPKPGFGVVLEGISRLEPGDTQIRFGASYGIGPISLGAGSGVRFGGGEVSGLAGFELSLRLTPWGNLRTPVVDLHTRLDFSFAGERTRTLLLGTRLLLDVI